MTDLINRPFLPGGVDHSAELVKFMADANLSAQRMFVERLCVAQSDSGRSVEEVAEVVGADADDITRALTGQHDLSLTEIRHLALALNIVVDFRISSAEVVREVFLERMLLPLAHSLYDSTISEDLASGRLIA